MEWVAHPALCSWHGVRGRGLGGQHIRGMLAFEGWWQMDGPLHSLSLMPTSDLRPALSPFSLQGIKQVPPFISSLTALSDLRLCGCSLGMLPREVSTLRSLTLLKLNSNPLGRGPSGDPE